MKIRYVSRNTFKRHVDVLLIGEEGKKDYFLINDFIIHVIVEENIFVVIAYKLLAQKKY